jgi:large subunit ribosomal protein L23
MALFSTKTPKKAKAKKEQKATSALATKAVKLKSSRGRHVGTTTGRTSDVLRAPWLSEKALIGTERGVYVFEISDKATKHDVAAAVFALYKVTPRKVRIVNLPAKLVMMRSRRGLGTQSARRKAYVSLKEGETIQFA